MSGGDIKPLTAEQRPAVDPAEVVWLSASAGTGKTQVLSARVLRLLLQDGVSPGQILCLTFTKAGATEMAARINTDLARWVRAKPESLASDLKAIGADYGPEAQTRARRLFTQVLDCPGGGLRIDTIHAFSQWLLAAFPHEAGLTPGVKAMDDREKALLLREVLADLLVEAERTNDAATLGAIADLSMRLGPDAVQTYLLRCAAALEVWTGPGGWQVPMAANVKRLIGLPSDASTDDLPGLCADDVFDVGALECCLSAYRSWTTATSDKTIPAITDWLAASPEMRLISLDPLYNLLFTADQLARNRQHLVKFEESFVDAAANLLTSFEAVRERQVLLELAKWLTPALELGGKFALAWDAAKARSGLIDFDDQIRLAAGLLKTSALAEWIRYKLDRQFDHILVDEAQDTNQAQWQIIDALTGDFFAGAGQHGDKLRTLFVVGDTKQAIFRFQGTSPEHFAAAKERVKAAMIGLADNQAALRGNAAVRELQDLPLGKSFRTARQVLEFVDLAIDRIGPVSFGLDGQTVSHVGEERPGQVVLWQTVGGKGDDSGAANDNADEGAEGWLARSDRQLADRIARQVRDWLKDGFALVKDQSAGTARRAGPGDVMVLVRKRKELAGLIVARLHAAGVPVAGVDRLRLAAPLGVRDLIAALRFAVQPLDDLNLACLLTSPLIGWSQDQLLEHGYRPDKVRLWRHLLDARGNAVVAGAVAQLLDLLRQADFEPPQALLHWVLTGPWQGRRRLTARLGSEVGDPIDELLNAASAFAASEVPSLHTFLRWFEAGEGELKREAGKNAGEVRVMTVHGAKGLQAPIVILADAADNPTPPGRRRALALPDPPGLAKVGLTEAEARLVPLPPLAKAEQAGPIAAADAAAAKADMEEHWRLLYVAMTRAEEALFVAGSLSPREEAPAEDSWYARLHGLFLGDEPEADAIWGQRWVHGEGSTLPLPPQDTATRELDLLPPWLETPVAAEPRPPRPLAPSALGHDDSADPPFAPGSDSAAARRGVLLHRLLERLPEVEPAAREAAAAAWLARAGGEFTAPARAELVKAAITVLAHPGWADLFAPGSLAEVPIAATVGEHLVAGTIDRLLITDQAIRLVDFKTARRPPASLDAVPVSILRQMAAYVAALEVTYPGRPVQAAVLYTQVPMLLELPAALLAAHKPGLSTAQ